MRRRRAPITAFILLTGLMGITGLWLRAQLRQYALNRRLIAALVKHDIRMALALVYEGADPNTSCNPPPAPTFKLLWNQLLHRSNVPGKHGTTALLLACGAEWNDYNHSAIKASRPPPDAPQLVQAMLRHGADVNAPDARGWTPLLWAVYNGRGDTVAVLLEYGADANEKNDYGYMPLMYALSYPDMVRLLVTHGADVNVMIPPGLTHLTLAVQYDADPEVVRLLLEYGARVDAQDGGGCTALSGGAIGICKTGQCGQGQHRATAGARS